MCRLGNGFTTATVTQMFHSRWRSRGDEDDVKVLIHSGRATRSTFNCGISTVCLTPLLHTHTHECIHNYSKMCKHTQGECVQRFSPHAMHVSSKWKPVSQPTPHASCQHFKKTSTRSMTSTVGRAGQRWQSRLTREPAWSRCQSPT